MDNFEERCERIRQAAHEVHASVNQYYDGELPYGVHLDMVAEAVMRHASELPVDDDDMTAVMFGAYFHDSIEDARLTYNDVMKRAKELVGEDKALLATEIVYALTNDKGRTRAERAGERYYRGIRETPYAPMVKLADRIANMTYSGRSRSAMKAVYDRELPHFLESITTDGADRRMSLPPSMVAEVRNL